jgi:hypothetical protein
MDISRMVLLITTAICLEIDPSSMAGWPLGVITIGILWIILGIVGLLAGAWLMARGGCIF